MVTSQRKKQKENAKWLTDGGLHTVLVGTGSPLPDPTRGGPCTVVLAGGDFLMFDTGPGCFKSMGLMGLPVSSRRGKRIATILRQYSRTHPVPGSRAE